MKRAYFLTTTFAMLLSCVPLSATEDVYREGLRYIQGSGVQKDKKKAAAAGNKAASKSLRELEESAKKDAKKDVRKSAKKSGSEDASISWSVSPGAEAEYLKGLKLMGDSNSFQEARSHIEAAAEQGYAEAQYELGCWYMSGHRLEKSETKAVEWWKKAAEQGHAEAQYELAKIAYYYAETNMWYRKAAEQGHTGAQLFLSFNYEYGDGVPQSNTEALKWLRQAAEQGLSAAQGYLANRYEEGVHVAKDNIEAARWRKRSIVVMGERLRREISSGEVRRATRRTLHVPSILTGKRQRQSWEMLLHRSSWHGAIERA